MRLELVKLLDSFAGSGKHAEDVESNLYQGEHRALQYENRFGASLNIQSCLAAGIVQQ
jgi:hypothetical protein